MNYIIVLFKNKEKKKIIKKFKTLERAKNYFNEQVSISKGIYFNKQIENANICSFELCMLEKKNNEFESLFVKDNFGRQIKVELDNPDYQIIKVSDYNIEEWIYDISKKEKITLETFYKKYIFKKGIILISRLNNKIVVQEDDKVFLFSLKNEDESQRFLECLKKFFFDKQINNCIVVSETSKSQKKYLYNILDSLGIDKKLLYRRSTTFKPR